MPPSKSTTLTEAELRLMDVFWRKDSATVQQVLDQLKAGESMKFMLPVRGAEEECFVINFHGHFHRLLPDQCRRQRKIEIKSVVSVNANSSERNAIQRCG